jgi:hypothetical protein
MVLPLLLLCGLVLFGGCSDNPEYPRSATVSALVIDEGLKQPVADVEVTLLPANMVLKTDRNGLAVFRVTPGRYFVDAKVCCVGPGFIEYHLPVMVGDGETVEVRLQACLLCL